MRDGLERNSPPMRSSVTRPRSLGYPFRSGLGSRHIFFRLRLLVFFSVGSSSGSSFFFNRLRLLIFFQPAPAPHFFQPAPAPHFFSTGSGSRSFLGGFGSGSSVYRCVNCVSVKVLSSTDFPRLLVCMSV